MRRPYTDRPYPPGMAYKGVSWGTFGFVPPLLQNLQIREPTCLTPVG